ncbi:MAG: hypothetical protein ABEJ90_05470 [Halobacterium sp.]
MNTTLRPESERRAAALRALPPIERAREGDRLRVTRAFRGTTLDQAAGYLETLGGERTGAGVVEGDGWRATLSAEEVPVGPSYRLTEVTVTWTGDADAVDAVVAAFRLKAFRAPG